MADTNLQQTIATQAREISVLKAARALPNTAATDLAEILNQANTRLNAKRLELESEIAGLNCANGVLSQENGRLQRRAKAAEDALILAAPGTNTVKNSNQALRKEKALLIAQNLALKQDDATLKERISGFERDYATMAHDNAEGYKKSQAWYVREHELLAEIKQQNAKIEEQLYFRGLQKDSLERKHYRIAALQWTVENYGIKLKEFKFEFETGQDTSEDGEEDEDDDEDEDEDEVTEVSDMEVDDQPGSWPGCGFWQD